MARDILKDSDDQVQAVIGVIRAAEADVILLLGVDYDLHGIALTALADRIGGFPHRFATATNRGLPTGIDLNKDATIGGAADAHGFAEFAGQNSMAVLSRLPIMAMEARNFSALPWRDLPGHIAPDDVPKTLRLSSTGHWDIPIALDRDRRLHLLAWHATPPLFHPWNRHRNHDETVFWQRYLNGALGETPPQSFVLVGGANLDPRDGDGMHEAMIDLLSHPRVQDPTPASTEGKHQVEGINARHFGNPALDTVAWGDEPGRPGNLRVDYVLPAANLKVVNAGVLWPAPETSLGRNVIAASRHRLVWVDIDVDQSSGDGN